MKSKFLLLAIAAMMMGGANAEIGVYNSLDALYRGITRSQTTFTQFTADANTSYENAVKLSKDRHGNTLAIDASAAILYNADIIHVDNYSSVKFVILRQPVNNIEVHRRLCNQSVQYLIKLRNNELISRDAYVVVICYFVI